MKRLWSIVVALCSLSLICWHTTKAQQGFVSIDCGATQSYVDTNHLTWTPDELLKTITHAGIAAAVAPPAMANVPTPLSTIRYFPGNQTKYCYVFNRDDHGVTQGNPYLVRASFWAGTAVPYKTEINNKVTFKLLIYADVWDDVVVTLPQTGRAVEKEMYVIAMKDTIDVCVAGKGIGMDIPFISSLVLRPLSINMSSVRLMIDKAEGRPLFNLYRINYGASSANNFISYRVDGLGDAYDRVWQPDTRMPIITTTLSMATNDIECTPIMVMQTAYQSDYSFSLTFSVPPKNSYYYSSHLAELSPKVTLRGQRVFKQQIFDDTNNLYAEDTYDLFDLGDNSPEFTLDSYSVSPIHVGEQGFINFTFTKENGSIYGPIICGLELLRVSDHSMTLGTQKDEVATLGHMTSTFASLNSWSGDPCLPYAYNWLTCTPDARPVISAISLSKKRLAGRLPTELNNFKALVELSLAENELFGPIPDLSLLHDLKSLDLHGNYLSGRIPEFLGELPSLTTLNLDDNNFSGQIPALLVARASSNKLKFSIAGNPHVCNENNNKEYCKAPSTSGNSAHRLVLWLAIMGAIAIAAVTVGVLGCCIMKLKKKTDVVTNDPTNRQDILGRSNQAIQFTFESIKAMTRNFERILGQGGFGPVYHGVLQNKKNVAVKLLAEDSRQGQQQFLNEVKLLSRVHHKNLVSLVGYCTEVQPVLVYDYMANGSLFDALNGKGAKLVAWRDRLHIAVDAAEGLDYLHRGCTPSIIHRDVKTSNILLTEELEGRISDFGISKSNQHEAMAQTSQSLTNVEGSFGYLDPVYAETNVATHSIDVYAFGIVLLEILTGKPPFIQPLAGSGESQHILEWAKPLIERGYLSRLVDPALKEDYNASCMWMVIDVAMMCVEHDRRRRPNMSEVMRELKEALSMELQNNLTDANSSSVSMYTTGSSAR